MRVSLVLNKLELHSSSLAGEIILDDLSFDILEALKNVDDVKEEEIMPKKRKTRGSYNKQAYNHNQAVYNNQALYNNQVREDDNDSDEEYSPPKVRLYDKTVT